MLESAVGVVCTELELAEALSVNEESEDFDEVGI